MTAILEPRTSQPAVTNGAAQIRAVQLGDIQLSFAWSENQRDQFLRLAFANGATKAARTVYNRPTTTFCQVLSRDLVTVGRIPV
jgi:hypothetical protein